MLNRSEGLPDFEKGPEEIKEESEEEILERYRRRMDDWHDLIKGPRADSIEIIQERIIKGEFSPEGSEDSSETKAWDLAMLTVRMEIESAEKENRPINLPGFDKEFAQNIFEMRKEIEEERDKALLGLHKKSEQNM